MLRKMNQRRGGFTLVEIMIVVAIIALLAAIAIPNFMRARKRAQATQILEDVRVLDSALAQYAIENNKSGTDMANTLMFPKYLKQGTRLYELTSNDKCQDLLGNPYFGRRIDEGMHICGATQDYFNDVIANPDEFWGSYKPLPGLPYQ